MLLDPMEPADKAMLEAGASKAEAGKAEPDIDYGAMEDGKDTARDSTPVLSASSTGRPASSTVDEQQMRNWKKNINTVWRDISGHRLGSMFVSPIKAADAPSYYEVIRRPLDLKTIKNRIRDEEITTTVEFYRDIMHMLMNALMYNAEDTEVYQMTMQIIPDAQACIEQLLQTEAAVNQPRGAGSGDGTTVEYADDVTNSAADGGDAGANSRINEAEEAAKGGNDDGGSEMQADADDSDSSVPNKRRRRAASERASKHLRA
ncbi:hypothetical protein GGI02_003777 [Coemansia sp. RSA 2322]|nr:hypothetical protein GGI02_003777 [Coemansia sp. RSA 2322]